MRTQSTGLARSRTAIVTVAILALVALPSVALAHPAAPGFERSTGEALGQKRYVAAGDRAYAIGAEDGSFPPMGWHIRGEMGGVWAHPIKLLDGYWFSVNGRWLPAATRFASGAGYTRMTFPSTRGLGVRALTFSPDGSPVVLVGLRLTNPSRHPKPVALAMDSRSELMGSYPWGGTTPTAKEVNGPDDGSFDRRSGLLEFTEPGKPWFAEVGASVDPVGGAVGNRFWGPVPSRSARTTSRTATAPAPACAGSCASRRTDRPRSGLPSRGPTGRPARRRPPCTRRLPIRRRCCGARSAPACGSSDGRGSPCPTDPCRPRSTGASSTSPTCRRTVYDAEIRDVDEGRAYPSPVATVPELTGIGAGYPDYPWLFGTDGAYTAYPLVASGQWDTAEHTCARSATSRGSSTAPPARSCTRWSPMARSTSAPTTTRGTRTRRPSSPTPSR